MLAAVYDALLGDRPRIGLLAFHRQFLSFCERHGASPDPHASAGSILELLGRPEPDPAASVEADLRTGLRQGGDDYRLACEVDDHDLSEETQSRMTLRFRDAVSGSSRFQLLFWGADQMSLIPRYAARSSLRDRFADWMSRWPEVADIHAASRRLLHRAEITRAADWLEARGQLGREVFTHRHTDEDGTLRAGRVGDITALRACLAAIRLPPDADGLFRVPGPPFWSVSDAAARIRTMLPLVGQGGAPLVSFLPEVPLDAAEREMHCRVAVAGTFLAGLQLTREGCIGVQQKTAWGDIMFRKGQMIASPILP